MTEDKFDILERPMAMFIIESIYENMKYTSSTDVIRHMTVSNIVNLNDNKQARTINMRIKELEEAKILKRTDGKTQHNKKYIFLTEKGIKVAKCLDILYVALELLNYESN